MSIDKKTILIVDDASLVRIYYRSALENAGFRVEEALNGLEAFEKLLTTSVDLLLVDVNMPRMDGFTFLSTLRRKERPLSAIPAIVISTEAGKKDFDAGLTAGANFYLVKPVDAESLVEFASLFTGASR